MHERLTVVSRNNSLRSAYLQYEFNDWFYCLEMAVVIESLAFWESAARSKRAIPRVLVHRRGSKRWGKSAVVQTISVVGCIFDAGQISVVKSQRAQF